MFMCLGWCEPDTAVGRILILEVTSRGDNQFTFNHDRTLVNDWSISNMESQGDELLQVNPPLPPPSKFKPKEYGMQ